jgi:hypothetical protein
VIGAFQPAVADPIEGRVILRPLDQDSAQHRFQSAAGVDVVVAGQFWAQRAYPVQAGYLGETHPQAGFPQGGEQGVEGERIIHASVIAVIT